MEVPSTLGVSNSSYLSNYLSAENSVDAQYLKLKGPEVLF